MFQHNKLFVASVSPVISYPNFYWIATFLSSKLRRLTRRRLIDLNAKWLQYNLLMPLGSTINHTSGRRTQTLCLSLGSAQVRDDTCGRRISVSVAISVRSWNSQVFDDATTRWKVYATFTFGFVFVWNQGVVALLIIECK